MSTPKILAFTVTHGDRPWLDDLVRLARGSAGMWFDWLVVLSGASGRQHLVARKWLDHPQGHGIQHLVTWLQNRGQHHAFAEALELARAGGYRWLLRLDDDVRFRTRRWLKKLVEQAEELRRLAGDPVQRLVVGPKLVGLRHPPRPVGIVERGQDFPAEVMEVLGGACRLHPMDLFADFKPPLDEPLGRGDPEAVAEWCRRTGGLIVRFPNVRLVHRTDEIEAQDTPEEAHLRRMGRYWPWVNPET